MNDLAIGLPSSTTNYTYEISGDTTLGTVNATAADTILRGYVGVVEKYIDANQQPIISSIICEASAQEILPHYQHPAVLVVILVVVM